MAFFAKTVDGIVTKVISAKVSFFDTFIDTSPGKWLETFTDGTRMNYAGVGFTYDSTRDAFIPPQPYPSWTLNEDTCLWEASVAYPTDGVGYTWDEETTNWLEVTE
jgi:hypothetical protein